jgi:hypothetical protein
MPADQPLPKVESFTKRVPGVVALADEIREAIVGGVHRI